MKIKKQYSMKYTQKAIMNLLDLVIEQKQPMNLDIEVCSACNHRCVYCPVANDPFRQKVMPMSAFETILNKLQTKKKYKRIALNHYNEPFMDPFIIERIKKIMDKKMTRWLILYTNASMIQENQIEELMPYKKNVGFNINLPTIMSEERYKEVHGRNDLSKVKHNLALLIKHDFLIQINVQSNQHTTEKDYQSVVNKYGNDVKKINWIPSSTRSNLILDNKYYHKGKIIGCRFYRHTNNLHIGVDGGVFLCCEDYFKKSQFANILEQSLEDVLNSYQRKQYLKYIAGVENAPKDFICRTCKYAIVKDEEGMDWFFETARSNNLMNKF